LILMAVKSRDVQFQLWHMSTSGGLYRFWEHLNPLRESGQ
jgi:hypothetical protein